jgi:U5 small nuclear ribonucleoprotein component
LLNSYSLFSDLITYFILGNVIFASSDQNWSFSLVQFAQIYLGDRKRKMNVKPENFAQRLWGDIYFHEETRKFSKHPPEVKNPQRSFVEFILDPLYKLYRYDY